MHDINRLREILLETSEESHKTRKAWIPTHYAHGVVALNHLGATEERIREYIQWYTKHRFQLHHVFESQAATEKDSLFDLSSYKLGSQTEFYPILNEIGKQIEDCAGNFRKIVRDHFPRVSDGLACMLLHSLIQLGYGLSAESTRTVAEGISYLYCWHVSPYTGNPQSTETRGIGDLGKETLDLMEVLRQKYVDSIQLPDNLSIDDVNADAWSNWVVDVATIVFVTSEVKNDFILLHGVTGAWSLKQVLLLLNDKREIIRAARTLLVTLLAVCVARQMPALNPDELKGYPEKVDDNYWTKIKMDPIPEVCDEHYYKLVQVMYDMWKVNPGSTSLYVAGVTHCTQYEMIDYYHKALPLDERDETEVSGADPGAPP